MKESKKWLKRSIIPVFALAVLGTYLALPLSVVNAEEKILGQIEYDSIVLEGSYSAYSNNPVQYFSIVNVAPDAGKKVTKVVLRNKATKEIVRELPIASGNAYTLGNISGEKISVTHQVADVWDGTWNWWRDSTNPKVWMYDLDDRYYFLQDGVHDQPQPNAKKLVLPMPSDNNAPLPSFAGAEEVSDGNIGWARTTKVLPNTVSGDGQTFDVTKLADLKVSYEYHPKDERYIAPANILAVETESVNLTSRQLTFRYKARFVDVYTAESFGSQGLINEYHTAWKVSLSTEVYKYPQLEIVYYQEPAGGGSPSTGASSTPTPTPTTAPTTDDLEVVSLSYNPAVFTARDDVTFTYTFRNNSKRALSNFYYSINSSETLFPGSLDPGKTYTSTLTRKIDSTWTLTVKVDSRNQIPESNESNNEKSVTVTPQGIANNSPPEGRLRWFLHGSEKEVSEVTEGTWVDLKYVDVRDPEGDAVGYKMNFADANSEWLRTYMTNRWGEGDGYDAFSGINTTGGMGYHVAKGYLKDNYGAVSGPLTAGLTVIPPNPVAVITGQSTVKEARPLTQPFSAANSYSPLERSIDHNRDEWGNKQNVYYTPGAETITLKVWDSAGLPSLNTAAHTLTVLPDLPPVALLKTQSKAIRGMDVSLKDASYSPDQDTIKFVELFVQYDANNNGSFADDPETPLYFDSSGNLTRKYDKVGKYRYRIRAVEDSPLNKEDTSYTEVEVVNDSPWVSFEMASEVKEPQIIPMVSVSLDPDNWTAASTFDETVKKNWRINDDGSMGTYPFYTQTKADGVLFDPSSSSYRTADPNTSEIITRFNYGETSDDGSDENYYTYYVGTLGTIVKYSNYCGSCGNQYYNDVQLFNLSGTLIKKFYSGEIYDINIFADEIVIGGWYYGTTTGTSQTYYGVYKISSLFANPNTAAPIRTYLYNNPPPKSGNFQYHLVPRYSSSGLGYGTSLPPGAVLGSQIKLSDSYNAYSPQVMKVSDAGPSKDGTVISIKGFGLLGKTTRFGTEVWNKNFAWKEGNTSKTFHPQNLWYNQDESRVYVIGQQMAYEQDIHDYDWYWVSKGWHMKVLNAADGSEIRSIPYPAGFNSYNQTGATYMGKLVLITPNGLYVYDDSLNLQKFDNRVTGGRITGDGFIVNTGSSMNLDMYGVSNWYTVYDLRTYGYYASGNNVERFPSEMYYDTLANEGISKQVIGSTVNTNNDEDQKHYRYYEAGVRNIPIANRPLASHSQLFNSGLPSMQDFNLTFKYRYADLNYTSYNMSGMSFKIQDRRNMYRLEFNNTKLNLVKIVDGNRTILHTQDYAFDKGTYYSFRIRSNANKHTVYVNGVPLFDVTDGTFQAGTFGPSTDFFNVSFKDMTYQDLSAASGSSLTKDTVIVDQTIQYALTFEDTENDPHPIDLTWWQFEQTSPWKFLDAGDGKTGWSTMNGTTQHGSLPSLDRVGVWRVTHWLKDDPHPWFPFPSEVFGSYRAESNRYSRNIIVHRRPVALFTLWLNGDGTVGWNEQSYDPDRWLSSWNYSTESPVYASNRGIYARKYKYITPSGLEQEGKLTRPTESGVYTVSEAVMDEYGAWSDWYDQQITANIVLPPNKLPVVDFEFPSPVYRDDLVQLTNKSYDPDGDPLTYSWNIMKPPYTSNLSTLKDPAFIIRDRGLGKDAVSPNWFITLEATDSKGETGSKTKSLTVLNHIPTTAIYGQQEVLIRQTQSYTSGGADLDSEDSGHLSYYWKVTEPDGTETDYSGSSTLSLTFNKGGTYKLEHWVIDPVGDSSNIAQLLVSVDDNKPPVPGFTITPNPAYRGEAVGIVSTASDPDGIIARHDYWITGPDSLEQHVSTEADWSRTYSVLGDYTIRQRVEDNKGALAETSQVLHIINRPPTVELTTPSGSDAEHPSVNIPPFKAEWTYEDEDGDPQASYTFAIYEYPSGTWKTGTTGTGTASHFNVPTGILQGGVTYYATVTVSDGYDTTTSQPKYFILNRPPVADFIWSPSPVYEGDTVKLTNKSYDPDGDLFTSRWTVKAPDGNAKSYDTTDVSVRWTQVGSYTVTLTVTDSYGDSNTVTKTIQVLPLGISGFVGHTETWNNNRAKFNAKQEREETGIHRNDDEFWAGEAFILTADTTNTGTATYAVSVDVIAEGDPIPHDWAWYHLYTEMEPEDSRVKWKGRMNSPDPDRGIKMEQLSDGPLDFTFEVTYSNGTVKQDVVRIYMRNKWTEYWQVHRAW